MGIKIENPNEVCRFKPRKWLKPYFIGLRAKPKKKSQGNDFLALYKSKNETIAEG